jgi:hypothetical protein
MQPLPSDAVENVGKFTAMLERLSQNASSTEGNRLLP